MQQAGSALGGAILVTLTILMHADDANPAAFENQIKKCTSCKKKTVDHAYPRLGLSLTAKIPILSLRHTKESLLPIGVCIR